MAVTRADVELRLRDKITKAYKRAAGQVGKSNNDIETGLKKVEAQSKKTNRTIRDQFSSTKLILTGIAAFMTGRLVKSFIKAGSEVEDLTTEFKVLLGSVDAARARMVELEKFAQTTPFQLSEVATASKVLETFTKGALSTGEALRMVGDAAAITGEKDFAGLAMWVGRAYDGLQNNRPVGEAMMRLQELALVSGSARAEIERLQEAGRGKDAWNVLEGELKKAKGGMAALSETATGLSSTIKDQIAAAMRQMLASGAWDRFKTLLGDIRDRMNKLIESGIFAKFGQILMNLGKFQVGFIKDWLVFLDVFGINLPNVMKIAALAFTGFLGVVNTVQSGFLSGIEMILKGIRGMLVAFNKLMGAEGQNQGTIDAFSRGIEKIGTLSQNAADRAKTAFSGDLFKTANEDAKEFQKTVNGLSTSITGAVSSGAAVGVDPEKAKKLMEDAQAFELQQIKGAEAMKQAAFEKEQKRLDDGVAMALDRGKAIRADIEKTQAARREEAANVVSNLGIIAGQYKKFGVLYKAAAISQTIIDTYKGAQAAYSAMAGIPIVGPALGAAAAAVAVGAGIARVAQIQAQKFAQGGIVPGNQNTGDRVPAMVNSGEMILNKAQQTRLLAMANGAGGGGQTINFSAPIINIENGDPDVIRRAVGETYQEMLNNFALTQRDAQLQEVLA